jgi:lipopolysaccharide transport system ATP-binding protein
MKIIEVKNIGKKYNINHERGGYIALRDVITNIFKNPFSFIKSRTKEIFGIDTKEEFWALKNINFEIEKGDIVGIIGHNGAGKSTLLKILSQITPPTKGEIKISGTIGSLLEVGTGFHPELTGRENIFLNGAILGIKKRDIVKKFDDIVKFAEVEKFIDTPVKYYSSGMYVRLAFSVAAHMDTDILIVDEVLAVGDIEFQKKCLGKIEEITTNKGRTIIFVSHNTNTIRELCNKTILLENGQIVCFDKTDKVVDLYVRRYVDITSKKWERSEKDNHENKFLRVDIFEIIEKEEDLFVSIEINIKEVSKDLTIGYALYSENEDLLYWSYHTDGNSDTPNIKIGKNTLKSKIPKDVLNSGKYRIELIGGLHNKEWFFEPNRGNPTLFIKIDKKFEGNPLWTNKRPGLLAPKIKWDNN